MEKHKSCCFIGHRKVEEGESVAKRVKEVVERLILEEGIDVFCFGSKSQFNDICHEVVTELKNIYPHIIRIAYTCRGEGCVLEKNREKLEAAYTYATGKQICFLGVEVEREYKDKYSAGRAGYIQRNQAMIEDSDYCVLYYREEYFPNGGKTKSGTEIAYKYILQKKKEYVNIAEAL